MSSREGIIQIYDEVIVLGNSNFDVLAWKRTFCGGIEASDFSKQNAVKHKEAKQCYCKKQLSTNVNSSAQSNPLPWAGPQAYSAQGEVR